MPTAGLAFPVFLTQQENQDELLEVVKNLCLLHADPFVLLTPTRRRLSPPTEQMLAQRKALFLALENEMPFDEQGGLQVQPDSRRIVCSASRGGPRAWLRWHGSFPDA